MSPVMAAGVLAAVAIPAFMDYMKAPKRSEAELYLGAIGKAARVEYITNGALPVMRAPLTPARSCCELPRMKCETTQHDWHVPGWDMVVDPVVLKRAPGADFDWDGLEATLVALKKDSELAERADIEVAAESTTLAPLTYDHVVHAMDVAVKVGFTKVELTEQTSLSWRPTL